MKLVRKVRQLKLDVVFVHSEDTVTGMLFIELSRWLPYLLVLDDHMVEKASVNPYREYALQGYDFVSIAQKNACTYSARRLRCGIAGLHEPKLE